MNALQKGAWWNLAWTSLASAAVLITWPWLDFRALAFFGLMGFCGFTALFYRRPGFRAVLDERDLAIEQSARALAMRLVYVFFILGFTAIMLAFGSGTTVPGKWLNLLVWTGIALVLLVHAGSTLWQYRRDANHAASP